jgi:hypothetical protein
VALALIRTSHARQGTEVKAQLAADAVPASACVRDLPIPRDH